MQTKSISNHGHKLIKVKACRAVGRLGNGIHQDATFEEELDLIEAQS